MEEGMFLGYKVNAKGIKVCLDKGKLASLNRFLSKSVEKSLPFFKTLKKCTKKSDFQWTTKAKVAFKQIKKLISELPTLTAPIIYLAAANETLGKYDIQYRPKTSVKGQILADFVVEHPEDDSLVMTTKVEEELPDPWTLFTDGSSCVDGSGAGLILTSLEETEFTYALSFKFDATNNEAEYEALIAGLRIAEQMSVKNLQTNVDFHLVANQVNGSYIAIKSCMVQYLEKVKALASSFKKFSIKHVPRSENKKAYALSKITSTSFAHLTKQVLVEELKEKFINEAEVLAVVEEEGDTWMTPIYNYLTEETLLADKEKARAVRRKSIRILQYARRLKIRSSKGHTDGILLANNAYGCKKDDSGMPRLRGITHSNNGVKSYAFANASLLPSIHKPMAWWREQTEAWENE
ncbi:reverse transcriptase domain-containing protein [Tanacetum coccineum]